MTCATLLLGCSGLVIEVGSENDGLTRSTRLSVGAIGRHPLPLSGLMQLGLAGVVAGVDLLELEDASDPPHALATSATTRPRPSSVTPGRAMSFPCRRRRRAGGSQLVRGKLNRP